MKTTILTCLISFTFACASAQDNNEIVRNIDKKILSINRETRFQIATLKNDAFLDTAFIKQPDKGYGQLTGYFKNDTIYKIREFIGISQLHDMAITEYYFSDSKLIFVKETEEYGTEILSDSLGSVDHKKDKADFEGQYYFADDKIISTNKKGKQQILPNEIFFDSQSKEGQLLLSAKKYKDLFTNENK